MLQDTNRALQLYMNKILMRIINNKQLEDVLSIDQPTKQKEPVNKSITNNNKTNNGPTPTKTVSTTSNNTTQHTTNTNRQRRRTISYWGSKVPSPPPPSKSNSEKEIETVEDRRRHSSIVPTPPQPERSVSTSTTTSSSSTNGGWAKALRRMSVIGWSSVKEELPVQNDSAVGSSLSEEEEGTCVKSSGSSTPSIRRSNELGTLAEE